MAIAAYVFTNRFWLFLWHPIGENTADFSLIIAHILYNIFPLFTIYAGIEI